MCSLLASAGACAGDLLHHCEAEVVVLGHGALITSGLVELDVLEDVEAPAYTVPFE